MIGRPPGSLDAAGAEEEIRFLSASGEELPALHHLSLNPRGKFVLRVTVAANPKEVGTRIVQQLRTADPALALEKRDAIIEAFKIAGFTCRNVVMARAENVGQNCELPIHQQQGEDVGS